MLHAFRLVYAGVYDDTEVRGVLVAAGTRNLEENLSDLRAQVAHTHPQPTRRLGRAADAAACGPGAHESHVGTARATDNPKGPAARAEPACNSPPPPARPHSAALLARGFARARD